MSYFIAPPFKFPESVVTDYEKYLLRKLKKNYNIIQEQFEVIDKRNFGIQKRQDDIVDDINLVVRRLNEILDQEIEIIKAYEIADNLIYFVRDQIKSILTSKTLVDYDFNISVNVFENQFESQATLIRSWVDSNVKRIKGLNSNQLAEISEIISRGYRAGFNYATIANQIQYQLQINQNKAKLIARTEISSLNSDYQKSESLKYGFNDYIWKTAGDERVRPSHQVLNNKVMSWLNEKIFKYKIEDKKWLPKIILPATYKENGQTIKGGVQKQCGQDINCRCTSCIVINLGNRKKSIYKNSLYIT